MFDHAVGEGYEPRGDASVAVGAGLFSVFRSELGHPGLGAAIDAETVELFCLVRLASASVPIRTRTGEWRIHNDKVLAELWHFDG